MPEDREYMKPSLDWSPRWTRAVKYLMLAILIVFLGQVILDANLHVPLTRILSLDADRVFGEFWLWQLLTYAFIHSVASLWHIIFVECVLYWFGREIESYYGTKRFLVLFFGAILFGGLLFGLFIQIIGDTGFVLAGANGAVLAIALIYAILWPDREVLFFWIIPMKMKWFVPILIAIDQWVWVIAPGGSKANIFHLGGILFGFLFWRFSVGIEAIFEKMADRERVKSVGKRREMDQRVDEILDKINREGMHTLTRQEKNLLKRASKQYRDGER